MRRWLAFSIWRPPSGRPVRIFGPAPDARAVLFLGHGAGGGVTAPDLAAASAAALSEAVSVVLVEQPYRVAGRRSPEQAPRLDAAWLDVLAALRPQFSGLPLVVGGRSSG